MKNEPEKAYRSFLRWVQTGASWSQADLSAVAAFAGVSSEQVKVWAGKWQWQERFNDSEIGAEKAKIVAEVQLALDALSKGRLSDGIKALIAHNLAHQLHRAKEGALLPSDLKDLTTALKQIDSIERLDEGLATEHVAIQGLDDQRLANLDIHELRVLRKVITKTTESDSEADNEDG